MVVTALGFSLILKEAQSCPMQEDAEVPRVLAPPAYTASNSVSAKIAIATLMQIDSEKLKTETRRKLNRDTRNKNTGLVRVFEVGNKKFSFSVNLAPHNPISLKKTNKSLLLPMISCILPPTPRTHIL